MKVKVIFLFTIILTIFLRFYRIKENLSFNGELGDNYLAIKDFLLNKTLPVLGPPTSHPWLSFGPLFYWLFAPVLVLFKYKTIAGAYFFALIGVVTVILNFVVIRKIFDEKVALISSFLISISPAFIDVTRQSRFFSLVIPLFYVFYLLLIKVVNGSKKYFFWLGFTFGIMLNFHYTPLVFTPVVIYYLIKNGKLYIWKDYLKMFIGFLIPNIPFLIYNITHSFVMLKEFSIWIPYRILGFSGVYHKNTLSYGVLVSNVQSLISFISSEFLPNLGIYMIPVAIIFFGIVLYLYTKDRKKQTEVLILLLLVGYLALFVHGEPPSHYYFPILPIPIILATILIGKLAKNRTMFILTLVVIITIFINNLKFYFSESWFYQSQKFVANEELIPFKVQEDIAKKIVSDAKGRPFSLSRIGQFDYFDRNYAQNYIYLLWLYGNEPKEDAKLRYIIHEEIVNPNLSSLSVDNVAITKNVE